MDELLERSVDEIIDRRQLESALKGKGKLRLKLGVDPSAPDIHLGHTVVLRKLRALQDMGHKVIFLIGDFTAKIGDPSGRSTVRPVLSDKQIDSNAQTYLDQVGRILDVKKAEIRRNSEWLGKLDLGRLLELASNFTVAQLIERDDFKTRLSEGRELALSELLYPVMQAYDSIELKADVELGGSDQRFNILAGRALMKKMGRKPQQVFLTKLLIGTDGKHKMSKSLGNYIAITDPPHDMYGKVMSVPDELIAEYYELLTDVPTGAIEEAVKSIAAGANPRDAKASLAKEITAIYHGKSAASQAETDFDRTFRDKQGPSEGLIEEIKTKDKDLVELLAGHASIGSKTAARRLITQGAVRLNGQIVDTEGSVKVGPGDLIQVGKKRFLRLSQ